MNENRWQQIEDLYHQALRRRPDERERFLSEACVGDDALRSEVLSLISYDDRAENFLKRPPMEVAATKLAQDLPTVEVSGPAATSFSSELIPGGMLRHFRILRKIGQGGMGEIYQAEDTKLGREVAIKLLPEDLIRSAGARERFLREARAASALNHSNIVTVHAIEESDGLDFIVMEFVKGKTLSRLIAEGPMPLDQLLDIGLQVTRAISAAHASGIIHRDIKPANILITESGQAKVLDFGLAKRVAPSKDDKINNLSGDLTEAGLVMGTIVYMSPEQTRGEPLDLRSDLFSLGVVLYEAATGRLPFEGPSALTVMHEIATSDPPAPSRIVPSLPREFDLLIERAMAKDKLNRFQESSEIEASLSSILESRSSASVAPAVVSQTASASLVGREPQLRRLESLLESAINGSGKVVFITGEPGMGKTSVSDEFLKQAGGSNIIRARGRCVEQYGTGEAYLPFLDALGGLLQGRERERMASMLRTYAPTWCLQFPGSFASKGAMEQLQRETIGATKERMMRELADCLEAVARTSPILMLLEDLHWADPSSVDLLRHLCQRADTQRMMVVGTYRPEDIERTNHPLKKYKLEMEAHSQCEEIALRLLTEEQLSEYLNARFKPNNFASELAALVQRKTEGHPLFATSLITFLSERGDLIQASEGWRLARPVGEMDLEAPENVRSMIRKKIQSLDEEDRRTLQFASIEGDEFHSTVLAELLGVEEVGLEERLERVARLYRLVDTVGDEELPDGTLTTRYRFAHALFQNELYGEVLSKRRVLLHRKAGEKLREHFGQESSRIATQLAIHFERGREFELAISYLIHAGDNAVKLFASDEARDHYTRALGLIEKLPAANRAAVALRIYQQRGAVNLYVTDFPQAVNDYRRMRDCAMEMGDAEAESNALIGMSHAQYWAHQLDEMATSVYEAVRAVERSKSEPLRLELIGMVAAKHNCYGELDEAKPLLEEVIRSGRAVGHKPALLNGLIWRGQLHFFQTEYKKAEEILTEARVVSEELRNGFQLLHSLFFLGLLRANTGRMSEALATLNEAIEMAARNGDRFWVSRLPNCIGFIHNELQDFEGALRYNKEGVKVAQRDKVLEAESNSLINLGSTLMQVGKPSETLPAFRNVEEIFARDAWFRWRYNIRLQAGKAQYWLKEGNLEQAEQYAKKLLDMATQFDAGKYIASAHKVMAEIAIARNDLSSAESQMKTALKILEKRPVVVLAWKAYALNARLSSQLNQPDRARESYKRAAEMIDNIARNVTDDRLRTIFLTSNAVQEVVSGLA